MLYGSLMGTHMKPVVVATEDYSVILTNLEDSGRKLKIFLLMEELFLLKFGQGTVQNIIAHTRKKSKLQAVSVQ
jgi:hypothetical protein